MTSLPDFLEYLPACKVILCKTHGFCLRQPRVLPHLQSAQHNITRDTLDAVAEAMSNLDIAVKVTDAYLPVAGSAPIKGLPILDGFECCATEECPYLTVYPSGLQSHMTAHHFGEGSKKKIEHCNKVKLQRLFMDGKKSLAGYFIVDPESSVRGLPQVSALGMSYSMRLSSSSKITRAEVIDLEEDDSSESEELDSGDPDYLDSTAPSRLLRSANPVTYAISQRSFYPTGPVTPVKRKTKEASPLRTSKKILSDELPSRSSKSMNSSFENTIFCTERRDKDMTHICMATDLIPADSALPVDPENLEFDLYCGILRNKKILEYSYQLEFTDAKGRRAQITDQMTFRAAILVQVGQNVDMVTFYVKPNAQMVRVTAQPTTSPSVPVQTHPIDVSLSSPFAHTVFRTECLDTGNLHVCLASDLAIPTPSNAVLNLTSDNVEYNLYRRLLRTEKMLDDDQTIGFNDANGRRVPVTNQMMFRAAVIYQISRNADMISFTSSRAESIRKKGERAPGIVD